MFGKLTRVVARCLPQLREAALEIFGRLVPAAEQRRQLLVEPTVRDGIVHREHDLSAEWWFTRRLLEHVRDDGRDQLPALRALAIERREHLVLGQEHFPTERQIRPLRIEPVDPVEVDREYGQVHVLDAVLGRERAVHDGLQPETGLLGTYGTQPLADHRHTLRKVETHEYCWTHR